MSQPTLSRTVLEKKPYGELLSICLERGYIEPDGAVASLDESPRAKTLLINFILFALSPVQCPAIPLLILKAYASKYQVDVAGLTAGVSPAEGHAKICKRLAERKLTVDLLQAMLDLGLDEETALGELTLVAPIIQAAYPDFDIEAPVSEPVAAPVPPKPVARPAVPVVPVPPAAKPAAAKPAAAKPAAAKPAAAKPVRPPPIVPPVPTVPKVPSRPASPPSPASPLPPALVATREQLAARYGLSLTDQAQSLARLEPLTLAELKEIYAAFGGKGAKEFNVAKAKQAILTLLQGGKPTAHSRPPPLQNQVEDDLFAGLDGTPPPPALPLPPAPAARPASDGELDLFADLPTFDVPAAGAPAAGLSAPRPPVPPVPRPPAVAPPAVPRPPAVAPPAVPRPPAVAPPRVPVPPVPANRPPAPPVPANRPAAPPVPAGRPPAPAKVVGPSLSQADVQSLITNLQTNEATFAQEFDQSALEVLRCVGLLSGPTRA